MWVCDASPDIHSRHPTAKINSLNVSVHVNEWGGMDNPVMRRGWERIRGNGKPNSERVDENLTLSGTNI